MKKKIKKYLSIILSAVLCVSIPVNAAENEGYYDVSEGNYINLDNDILDLNDTDDLGFFEYLSTSYLESYRDDDGTISLDFSTNFVSDVYLVDLTSSGVSLSDEQFSFSFYGWDLETYPGEEDLITTVYNDENGKISIPFDETFSDGDENYYLLLQNDLREENITYDTSSYTVDFIFSGGYPGILYGYGGLVDADYSDMASISVIQVDDTVSVYSDDYDGTSDPYSVFILYYGVPYDELNDYDEQPVYCVKYEVYGENATIPFTEYPDSFYSTIYSLDIDAESFQYWDVDSESYYNGQDIYYEGLTVSSDYSDICFSVYAKYSSNTLKSGEEVQEVLREVSEITSITVGTEENYRSEVEGYTSIASLDEGNTGTISLYNVEGSLYILTEDNEMYLNSDSSRLFADLDMVTTITFSSGVKFDNLNDISEMFANDSQLTTIYSSENIYSESVERYDNTFAGCENLVGDGGSYAELQESSGTMAMFEGYLTHY